jgi:ribosome-binding protein aMBF1 (putative translation factor)
MSERMKGRPTHKIKFIEVIIGIPGKKEETYQVPNTSTAKQKLKKFFEDLVNDHSTKNESTPWREIAKDEIAKYTEVGIALRGARYREGLSQKALAKMCGISQDNLSRMEHGKRSIGIKLAKKLGKALKVSYLLFIRKAKNL